MRLFGLFACTECAGVKCKFHYNLDVVNVYLVGNDHALNVLVMIYINLYVFIR